MEVELLVTSDHVVAICEATITSLMAELRQRCPILNPTQEMSVAYAVLQHMIGSLETTADLYGYQLKER